MSPSLSLTSPPSPSTISPPHECLPPPPPPLPSPLLLFPPLTIVSLLTSPSPHSPSLLSLLSHESQVRHYHIKHEDTQYYISDKHRFPSIKELIDYHKLNGGGLVTRLRKPPQQLLPQLNTLSPIFGRIYSGTLIKDTLNKGHLYIKDQPISWQYIFASERGQPLYNGQNDPSQCVRYSEVSLYL